MASGDEKKKKFKRKNDLQSEKNEHDRVVGIVVKKMDCIFGEPSSLSSYKSLIIVIGEIAKPCDPTELSTEITRWLAMLKIFHRTNFEEWKEKVLNLVGLYEFMCPLILKNITHVEIERHFLMLTDLLNTLYERYKK